MTQQDHKPTMKDVARLAGVSYQTVSCVVNNIPVVKEETRLRVLEAIQSLNYIPNTTARSLRSGKTRIIGLMIPDAHNPFFWQIVTGAEDEANKNGYNLLLSTTSMNLDREWIAFRALLAERLDGIIPLLTYPEEFVDDLKKLQKKKFPFVLFNSSSKFLDADVVRVHYENAAQELMQQLLQSGHRRIALICGIGRPGLGSDRVATYQESSIKAGITPDPRYLIYTRNTVQDGFEAACRLMQMEPRPTAIIGINDLMAFGAMQAVLQQGYRVPQDFSIAGFDDIQISSLLAPPLTTGRADGVEIGQLCVRLILQRLASPELPPQRVHLPTRLIIRGSTGPAPS
jgi:LacI family transcriptional regulator